MGRDRNSRLFKGNKVVFKISDGQKLGHCRDFKDKFIQTNSFADWESKWEKIPLGIGVL
jgi:hypothetical protein